MIRNSLRFGWLAYVSCIVLAAGISAAGDSITYPCSGTTLNLPVLRLDEASIDDVNDLQASGLVRSVDLVHARSSSKYIHLSF